MPNNTRTQIDAVWVDGYTPPASDWEDLERKVFGSWNGVRGGAYCSPAGAAGSAYTISGSGLQVVGPTRLSRGGTIYGAASAFIIAEGTWPEIGPTHAARARRIVQPISVYSTKYPWLWTRNHPYGGVGSVALACRLTFSRLVEVSDLYVPLRVVDHATLEKCAIHFRVASRRIVAPIAMPKMRILRIPRESGSESGTVLPEPLKTTADGLGFDFLPLVASPDEWYRGGAAQSFEYVCDKNNVIDVESYAYVMHLVEELGAQSPDEEFDGIRFAERKADCGYAQVNSTQDFVDLESSQNATEGDFAFSGIRMLIVDSDAQLDLGVTTIASVVNGIWIQDTSNWPRAQDCDTADDFSPNWIVNVIAGKKNGTSTWQCQFPSAGQRMNFTSTSEETRTQIQITPAQPKGNIYHALVPTFNVKDLRFQ